MMTLLPHRGLTCIPEEPMKKCCLCHKDAHLIFDRVCIRCWRRYSIADINEAYDESQCEPGRFSGAAVSAKDRPPPAWWENQRQHEERADPQPKR